MWSRHHLPDSTSTDTATTDTACINPIVQLVKNVGTRGRLLP